MDRRSFFGALGGALVAPALARAQSAVPTLGIMSGELGGTFVQIAQDLSELFPRNLLRVDVHLNRGSVQNLIDLAEKPGVDLATVAVDALPYVAQQHMLPQHLLSGISYIVKLYDNDVHVEAGPDIHELSDLNGKPVNIDVPGAGTNLTLRAIFTAYGVKPELREDPPGVAQAKLLRGEIAANCYCIGKPGQLFRSVPAGANLHLVPVPYDMQKLGVYVPAGKFTHADYPTLVPEDAPVETVGVGVVLAAFNFPQGSARYRNLATFTDYFFDHFNELLQPGHHPKWKDVNLAATQPGWTRFPEAQAWLDRRGNVNQLSRMAAARGQGPADSEQKQQLFREFQTWQAQQHR